MLSHTVGGSRRWWGCVLAVALVFGAGLLVAVGQAGAKPPKVTELHVAPWGKDSWPGTATKPFKTLPRAQQSVRAATASMTRDIVVNLHPGTFALSAPLQLSDAAGDSGRNGHRVIYQAYRYGTSHQRPAVISGGRTITDWRLVDRSRNIWRAEVGNLQTRQLYVNDRRARRTSIGEAQFPALTLTATGYVTDSAVPRSWSRPADLEFVYTGAAPWSEPRCGVESITGTATQTVITMKQPCFRRAVAIFENELFPGRGVMPFTIENSKSFLGEPGRFYLDRSQPGRHELYYVPRPGEDMRRATVVAPVLETLVGGMGTESAPLHDVTFRGLTFSHATWLQPSTPEGFVHYISTHFENGDGSVIAVTLSPQARSVPGNVSFLRSDRIVFERNRFQRLGAQALEVVGSENVIRGNVITDVSSGGILVGEDRPDIAGAVSRDDVIDNNWVHGIGVEYQGGNGIYTTRTTNVTISNNQINDVPYSGIFMGQAHEQLVRANGPQDPNAPRNTGARILENLVFDGMKGLSDGGGIYTTFKQGTSYETGTLIRGNVVHDMTNPYYGLYSDWGSTWQTLTGNVVYGVARSAGGCSLPVLNAGIENIRYLGNYWIHEQPQWACGPPALNVTLEDNTVLPAEGAGAACQAIAGCASIVENAGLKPEYQDLLSNP